MAQRADDDIALVNGRHAARRQLELVVARLVVEHAHRDEDAFFARYIARQSHLVPELAVLCN